MYRRNRELIIVLFLGAAAGFTAGIFFDRSICLFINILGIPCLACGITRAYLSLLKFDLRGAFYWHPLFWCIPFFLLGLKRKKIFYILGGLFLFVWMVRMYLYFPDTPPMKFNENALYIWIFSKLKNLVM